MDILGLTNLTIDTCLKLIKKHRGLDLKYEHIPLMTRVYDLIASGKTMGIFQPRKRRECSGQYAKLNLVILMISSLF